MTVLPLNPAENENPAALRDFLGQCRAAAKAAGAPQLVSISLEVEPLDPLAVLESIFEAGERHFYVERPSEGVAVAGAEAVLVFTSSGPERFAECQRFADKTLAATLAVGDLTAPFSGPLFFSAYAFQDRTEAGETFEAASVFVPRWQVATAAGRTVAVANLLIAPDTPVELLADKVWRARKKFAAFDYREPSFEAIFAAGRSAPPEVQEVAGGLSYEAAVGLAVQAIQRGEFEKIVLARAKDVVSTEPLHPLKLLNGLRQRFGDCFAFSVANGRGQSMIGASPERLLKVQSGRLTTEALAGSQRRGVSASEDAALGFSLVRNAKELAEHDYVRSSIVRCLQPLGLQVDMTDRPTLRKLANVQHLHTHIHAAVPGNVKLGDLLRALHPTPAVGGSPRDAAIARIRELEGFPRGLYAGALGWMDAHGNGEYFVGLRSALVDGSRARMYAGAGVVAGSDPVAEKMETDLKFSAMEDALTASLAE